MLLSIIPEKMAVLREGTPLVRVLKSPAPDMLMLGNDCLLVSTGMLTALDSEEELYAVMSREVAHYVLDHAIITVNKNIARAKRAQFWGAVADRWLPLQRNICTIVMIIMFPGWSLQRMMSFRHW